MIAEGEGATPLTSELNAFGVYVKSDALPESVRAQLVEEMRRAPATETPVYLLEEKRYVVAEQVRSVRTVAVSDEVRGRVDAYIGALLPELRDYFGEDLVEFEPVQFLRYAPGDHFVAHRDAEGYEEHHRARRVSIVTYLNGQTEPDAADGFGGGELLLMVFGDDPRAFDLGVPAAPIAGTLVAFRSDLVHEVKPITHGERYTLVTWARGPAEGQS